MLLLSCRGQESGHLVRSQVHRDVGGAAAQRRRAVGRSAETDQTQVRNVVWVCLDCFKVFALNSQLKGED